MHILNNTHLEGLYAVAMTTDECNYSDSEFIMYMLVSAKRINHRQ